MTHLKTTKILQMIFPFVLIGLIILGCTGYNNATHGTCGNFDTVISGNGSRGFVTTYHWSGDPNDNVITVPDTDGNGADIVKLGGYFGTGVPAMFEVEGPKCKYGYLGTDASQYEVPVEFKDQIFTLRIGENIDEVNSNLYLEGQADPFPYIGVEQADGSVVFYRILFHVECDSKNTEFYSKDGQLFLKEDNSLVRSLPYEQDVQ